MIPTSSKVERPRCSCGASAVAFRWQDAEGRELSKVICFACGRQVIAKTEPAPEPAARARGQ